jgi:glycosyltransferase involved in cell wall biosynthesis
LGREAGRVATEKGAALLSYSYYAHSAFSHFTGDQPRILFQLHPHPASVRSILREERRLHPDCASSLDKEWELALPESDFERLVEEVAMAQHWIVASQFTKQTLVDNDIPAERIKVVPYGIDLKAFSAKRESSFSGRPLRLLFVGTLGQRKGIKYLVKALELLPAGSVELTVCGRPVDDLAIFRESRVPIQLRPSISAQGLLEAYGTADVFVFPSLAEGFAHVLLEAMASGLPIISTTRTAAPDLIEHGREGFVINPGSPAELASHIEEFLRQPDLVRSMGEAARRRAEYFTWKRFRQDVAEFVGDIVGHATEHSIPQSCLSR